MRAGASVFVTGGEEDTVDSINHRAVCVAGGRELIADPPWIGDASDYDADIERSYVYGPATATVQCASFQQGGLVARIPGAFVSRPPLPTALLGASHVTWTSGGVTHHVLVGGHRVRDAPSGPGGSILVAGRSGVPGDVMPLNWVEVALSPRTPGLGPPTLARLQPLVAWAPVTRQLVVAGGGVDLAGMTATPSYLSKTLPVDYIDVGTGGSPTAAQQTDVVAIALPEGPPGVDELAVWDATLMGYEWGADGTRSARDSDGRTHNVSGIPVLAGGFRLQLPVPRPRDMPEYAHAISFHPSPEGTFDDPSVPRLDVVFFQEGPNVQAAVLGLTSDDTDTSFNMHFGQVAHNDDDDGSGVGAWDARDKTDARLPVSGSGTPPPSPSGSGSPRKSPAGVQGSAIAADSSQASSESPVGTWAPLGSRRPSGSPLVSPSGPQSAAPESVFLTQTPSASGSASGSPSVTSAPTGSGTPSVTVSGSRTGTCSESGTRTASGTATASDPSMRPSQFSVAEKRSRTPSPMSSGSAAPVGAGVGAASDPYPSGGEGGIGAGSDPYPSGGEGGADDIGDAMPIGPPMGASVPVGAPQQPQQRRLRSREQRGEERRRQLLREFMRERHSSQPGGGGGSGAGGTAGTSSGGTGGWGGFSAFPFGLSPPGGGAPEPMAAGARSLQAELIALPPAALVQPPPATVIGPAALYSLVQWDSQPLRYVLAASRVTNQLFLGTLTPCQLRTDCADGFFPSQCRSSPWDSVCERCNYCDNERLPGSQGWPCVTVAHPRCAACVPCEGPLELLLPCGWPQSPNRTHDICRGPSGNGGPETGDGSSGGYQPTSEPAASPEPEGGRLTNAPGASAGEDDLVGPVGSRGAKRGGFVAAVSIAGGGAACALGALWALAAAAARAAQAKRAAGSAVLSSAGATGVAASALGASVCLRSAAASPTRASRWLARVSGSLLATLALLALATAGVVKAGMPEAIGWLHAIRAALVLGTLVYVRLPGRASVRGGGGSSSSSSGGSGGAHRHGEDDSGEGPSLPEQRRAQGALRPVLAWGASVAGGGGRAYGSDAGFSSPSSASVPLWAQAAVVASAAALRPSVLLLLGTLPSAGEGGSSGAAGGQGSSVTGGRWSLASRMRPRTVRLLITAHAVLVDLPLALIPAIVASGYARPVISAGGDGARGDRYSLGLSLLALALQVALLVDTVVSALADRAAGARHARLAAAAAFAGKPAPGPALLVQSSQQRESPEGDAAGSSGGGAGKPARPGDGAIMTRSPLVQRVPSAHGGLSLGPATTGPLAAGSPAPAPPLPASSNGALRSARAAVAVAPTGAGAGGADSAVAAAVAGEAKVQPGQQEAQQVDAGAVEPAETATGGGGSGCAMERTYALLALLTTRARTSEGRRLAGMKLFFRTHPRLLPEAVSAVALVPLPQPWRRLLCGLEQEGQELRLSREQRRDLRGWRSELGLDDSPDEGAGTSASSESSAAGSYDEEDGGVGRSFGGGGYVAGEDDDGAAFGDGDDTESDQRDDYEEGGDEEEEEEGGAVGARGSVAAGAPGVPASSARTALAARAPGRRLGGSVGPRARGAGAARLNPLLTARSEQPTEPL